ncbi:hypothetical protein NPIL_438431 [Nephila pilipes]|uniref:Uncharacterized protein n=1 Tax=Nephila pilipes TaxID=299642 RepID=A0A8X6UL25_NEPPI|nr:hypothetical protein NPIL_438431 [Nephila pilipes]
MFLSGVGGCTRGRRHEKKRVYGHVPSEERFRIRRCDHGKKLRIRSVQIVPQRSGKLFYERTPPSGLWTWWEMSVRYFVRCPL